jgi:hypothetical protein
MITSSEKPKEIKIIKINNDRKKGNMTVKYAFRYLIKEVTRTEERPVEEDTTETVNITEFQYEEYISEQNFDIFMKSALPQILEANYKEIVPILIQQKEYLDIEIPTEFDTQ